MSVTTALALWVLVMALYSVVETDGKNKLKWRFVLIMFLFGVALVATYSFREFYLVGRHLQELM